MESIQAYTATQRHATEAEDVAVAASRPHNGALSIVGGATSAYSGLSVRLEIHGTDGTALIEDGQRSLLRFRNPGEDIGMFDLLPLDVEQAACRPAAVPGG